MVADWVIGVQLTRQERDAMNPLPRESEPVGGVGVDDLPVGAVLDVETANTHYRIENRGEGKVLISGHPDICPDPVLVMFHGSIRGEAMLKAGFIGREMNMEFLHPTRGIVRTSRVRDVHQVESPALRKN